MKSNFLAGAYRTNIKRELKPYELDIHVLKLGDSVAIVTNPCELFTEYGIKIKKGSQFKYTIVSELTNGYAGYVPTVTGV